MQQKVKLANSHIHQHHSTEQPRARAKVVIIGSGLAGLATAQRLYEAGIDDVIILEALDRVGGRVHTIAHEDYVLELGAQWLHGADENPLYKWLAELNMLDDFEDASLGFKGRFCTNLGTEVPPRLVDRVLEIARESKHVLSKDQSGRVNDHCGSLENDDNNNNNDNNKTDADLENSLECGKFKSASEVFRRELEPRIDQDSELSEQRELVMGVFDWFMRYETIENCCDSMDEVSTQSYTNWTDLGDGTLLNFKRGYSSLLEWFCGQFPVGRWLHLGQQVLSVQLLTGQTSGQGESGYWLDRNTGTKHRAPVLVYYDQTGAAATTTTTTTTTTAKPTSYIECDHVVVTASLGFLKSNLNSFFRPPLPEPRRALIEAMGFGTVNKIVLQFEEPFWEPELGGIKLVWTDREEERVPAGEPELPSWVRDIVAFDVVRRQPGLLIGWIGGRGAKLVELEQDAAIGRVCLKLLDRFLPPGRPRPTRLLGCLCSRWHSNPFTRGSYSFQSIASFDLRPETLHEPIYADTGAHLDSIPNGRPASAKQHSNSNGNSESGDRPLPVVDPSSQRVPRVLFAGEATAGPLYSTTHGAIVSGWREADRLAEHLIGSRRRSSGAALADAKQSLAPARTKAAQATI